MLGDELLGFGTQGEVGEDDIAVAGEQEAGKGEVDAWLWLGLVLACAIGCVNVPEPAPVTMAVLPETEKGMGADDGGDVMFDSVRI